MERVLGTSKCDLYPGGAVEQDHWGSGGAAGVLPEHEAGGTEHTGVALCRPPLGDFPLKLAQESHSSVPGRTVFLWSWFSLAFCFLTFSGHSSGSAAGLPRAVLKQNC